MSWIFNSTTPQVMHEPAVKMSNEMKTLAQIAAITGLFVSAGLTTRVLSNFLEFFVDSKLNEYETLRIMPRLQLLTSQISHLHQYVDSARDTFDHIHSDISWLRQKSNEQNLSSRFQAIQG